MRVVGGSRSWLTLRSEYRPWTGTAGGGDRSEARATDQSRSQDQAADNPQAGPAWRGGSRRVEPTSPIPARPALAAARRPTMRWGTSIVDHPRSYPDGQLAVRVDDTDTDQLSAAACEL
jgi:hypothetical protein